MKKEIFSPLPQNILDDLDEAIYTMDKKWRITYANKKAKKLLSRARTNLIGKVIWEAYPESKKWKSYKLLKEAHKAGKKIRYEIYSPIVHEYIEVIGTPYKEGMLIHFRPITERKLLEGELKTSRDQLHVILQNIADGITVQDKFGKLIYANKAAFLSNGYKSLEEMLQAPPLDYIGRFTMYDEHGKEFPANRLPGRRAIAGEKDPAVTIKFIGKESGEAKWVNIKSTAIYDSEGNAQLVVNVMHDMTREKEIEQRKDDFISMASHELKTPLTTIKVFVQVLTRKISDRATKDVLHKMDTQINKLTSLVAELLDITKIQQGKLSLTKEQFYVRDVVKIIVEGMQPITKHPLTVNIPAHHIAFGDKERIGQVITNLISNAIKYSHDAKPIIISSRKSKHFITISVQDFGIGIAEREQDQVFDRFYRAEEEEKTYPGLGLGLYISAHIIKENGGKIWVKSTPEEGSTFCFTLPLA